MTDVRQLFEFPQFSVTRDGVFVNTITGHVLKLSISSGGTLKVNFKVGGSIYCRSAAKIVCTMFHGRPGHDEMVYYKDGDMANISADNLAWKSRGFVYESHAQERRAMPYRLMPVMKISTGEVFENSLVAARRLGLLEKYIALAAMKNDTPYGGSLWTWALKSDVNQR
jgi:hypothetical protein